MIALSEWPVTMPHFTAASCPAGNFLKAAPGRKETAALRADLLNILQREAIKVPGQTPFRMTKLGVMVGATYVPDPECLVVDCSRWGVTGQQAIVVFSNEAHDLVQEFGVARRIVTQRIDDRRHERPPLLRFLFVLARKDAD